MNTVLAVDLGGTKTALARVDAVGVVLDRRKLPAGRSLEESVEQISSVVTGVDAVGVIVPGIFSPASGEAWCPNLWGDCRVPILSALRERLPSPVVVDSDRSGYVLGEAWLGAARGLRDVVFVAIGTGIGVGILSEGRLVRGAGGVAGAAGWFGLDARWDDRYAAAGCWEALGAGPGVAAACGQPDGPSAVAAARAGDETALRAFARAAKFSGMGVANLISALNPEAVVLGGGFLVGAADLLLDGIRAEVRRWAQPIAAAACRIELTQLGDEAGLFGAARLALDALSRQG